MSNLPDDWGAYYTTCRECGRRYHQSEGGCECLAEAAELDKLRRCDCCDAPMDDLDMQTTLIVSREGTHRVCTQCYKQACHAQGFPCTVPY